LQLKFKGVHMTLPAEKYAAGKDGLLEVLRVWDRSEESLQRRRDLFDCWLDSVKGEGWARGDVYRLVWEILYECASEFSEGTLDQLGEFETGLTGFCAEESIERFPNEPSDVAQLVEYVRGNRWR
jgi:hypothetical protein